MNIGPRYQTQMRHVLTQLYQMQQEFDATLGYPGEGPDTQQPDPQTSRQPSRRKPTAQTMPGDTDNEDARQHQTTPEKGIAKDISNKRDNTNTEYWNDILQAWNTPAQDQFTLDNTWH